MCVHQYKEKLHLLNIQDMLLEVFYISKINSQFTYAQVARSNLCLKDLICSLNYTTQKANMLSWRGLQ